MSDATVFTPTRSRTAPHRLMPALFAAEPRFAALGLLLACSIIPATLALMLDPRLFQAEPVWLKPLKFQLSLAVYLLSLAFFARFLPTAFLARRSYRAFSIMVVLCVLAEMAWIGGAAMVGTASHYNVAHPLMAQIYGLMGLLAVILTSASLVFAIVIWRDPRGLPDPALRLSVVLGLGLTFVLTVIVAGYMASQTGRLVGVPVTGARVPLMGWSREVGDLRLPHFLATHAMHVLPLAGLLAARSLSVGTAVQAVWLVAVAFVLVTGAAFVMAILELPVFPV
ncbi:MAG: hypothetical protein ACNA7O_13310 [Rhodobacterales bacterium]